MDTHTEISDTHIRYIFDTHTEIIHIPIPILVLIPGVFLYTHTGTHIGTHTDTHTSIWILIPRYFIVYKDQQKIE